MKVSQTTPVVAGAAELDQRYKSHDDFFSSCIDLVPAKIYLNPEDRLNWIKMKANEGSKKKRPAPPAPVVGKKKTGDDDGLDEDELETIENGVSFNKFDPRFFKTVTEILRDFQMFNKKLKKPAVKLAPMFAQNKAKNGSAQASTEAKVFNKSQNNPSKAAQAINAAKQAALETTAPAKVDEENGSDKKRDLKRSKAKQERQAQMKRQRYDSQCEPEMETIEHPEAAKNSSSHSRQPILNKNGEIVYSKFDFTADKTLGAKKSKHEKNNALPNNAKPKDYKKLLKKLQERREKVEEIKLSEPEKAKEMETKEKWKTAIDKAAGVKVKDDIGLLKKSLKKVEKKREKSRKGWDERHKAVEAKKAKVQEKRMKNINERKDKKKENKLKKLRKKGRILGF